MGYFELTPAIAHGPGTVFALLARSWEPLWNPELEENLRNFDGQVYDKPTTVGACTFVSCVDGQPVGMASYDPRQGPERAVLGYNCIIPEHQNKGYGRRQIQEILRILRAKGFQKAAVSTGEGEFFAPAQRMYEACGFREVGRNEDEIEYEVDL